MNCDEKFRAACLAATVAVSWTALPVAAQPNTAAATTVYLRGHSLGSGGPSGGEFRFIALHNLTYLYAQDLGKLPIGDSDESFNSSQPASAFESYAIIGAGSGGGEEWVSVTFNDQSAVGSSFATQFPGFDESTVAAALISGDSSMNTFLSAVAKMSVCNTTVSGNVTCTSTHFSNGVVDGQFTASFTPIPEPASVLCLAGFGFAASLRRRVPAP